MIPHLPEHPANFSGGRVDSKNDSLLKQNTTIKGSTRCTKNNKRTYNS